MIELQTNFGGGKTHSLLTLYHLCSGRSAGQLPGIEALMVEANIEAIPSNVSRAVLVGHKISPGKPSIKEDGTEVRTLWGELAWQLGGAEAYAMVAEDDRNATNPGDTLRLLFNKYAPCVVLIDEWIRYAAQLHETSDLPGGSFDTHFTFAQALSEAAKAADRTMLLVRIPTSDAIRPAGELPGRSTWVPPPPRTRPTGDWKTGTSDSAACNPANLRFRATRRHASGARRRQDRRRSPFPPNGPRRRQSGNHPENPGRSPRRRPRPRRPRGDRERPDIEVQVTGF
ncbi:MAG: DUF499 domain-containing protein [Pirellulaceae bacterium]